MGTTSSGISYGLTEVKKDGDYNIFKISFLEANNKLSDLDVKELINNKNKIDIVIYFNDAIVKYTKITIFSFVFEFNFKKVLL